MATRPETAEDKRSRKNLLIFFQVNHQALQQLFDALRSRPMDTTGSMIEHLNVLREDAFDKEQGLLLLLQNGLSGPQRDALIKVGVFGKVLRAKLELLWGCLGQGSLQPALKALNSILGSLAGVFGAADVLKEFKEMMEVAVERLDSDGDPIAFKFPSLPPLV